MKNRIIFILFFLTWIFVGCASVHTSVSSIAYHNIPSGAGVHVLPGNNSIESKKIVKIIKGQLQKKMYRLTELEEADIVISFSAEMLGAKTKTGTINTPVQTQVYDAYTGLSTLQTTGYRSQSYSATEHQREIRVQFHDGRKLRAKENETILWEAVGKSGGSSSDIIAVAPAIIASIFEEIGRDSDSKKHVKGLSQKH